MNADCSQEVSVIYLFDMQSKKICIADDATLRKENSTPTKSNWRDLEGTNLDSGVAATEAAPGRIRLAVISSRPRQKVEILNGVCRVDEVQPQSLRRPLVPRPSAIEIKLIQHDKGTQKKKIKKIGCC